MAPSTADVKIIPVWDATVIYPFSDPRNPEVRSVWTTALYRSSLMPWSMHPIPCHFD